MKAVWYREYRAEMGDMKEREFVLYSEGTSLNSLVVSLIDGFFSRIINPKLPNI